MRRVVSEVRSPVVSVSTVVIRGGTCVVREDVMRDRGLVGVGEGQSSMRGRM